MEDLNIILLRQIIEDVFKENDQLNVIFISEYIIDHKRYTAKPKIGKIIQIKNWHETIVHDESTGEGEVYATIKNLNRNDVIKYCSEIYKGHNEAYISFFNDEFLLYVSSDVIDIVSNHIEKITNLKQKYFKQFNQYHEINTI